MNIKKKINSINFKTLSYLVLFSVAILLLFWLCQTIFSVIFYERIQVKTMSNISNRIYESSKSELDEVLEDIVYNNNVCIKYVMDNGLAKEYNTKGFGCLLGRNDTNISAYMEELKDSKEEIKAIKLIDPEYDSKALLYGIKRGNGYIYVFTMLEDINTTTMMMRGQLVYLVFIAIVLAVLIAFFISKRITKPIEEITDKAKRLADGEYDVKFNKNGITEIDDLADALNYVGSEIGKTDEFRRDLMANVSHDLKTPLTMIKAYSEMVRDISYKNKKKREEHLDIIIAETDRLNVLVNDILTLSKLQANAEVLNIEEFDLDKEINNILKRYQIIKETENYIINYEGVSNAIVRADRVKINQVIYNLINNAINYTGDDKTVNIRLIDKGNVYRIEVEDHGKGIDRADIEHIWDKYYKQEKNHKRNVVGTGLGLSIVKNTLLIHGFKYGVNSEKKKGSTFYFEVDKTKSVNK